MQPKRHCKIQSRNSKEVCAFYGKEISTATTSFPICLTKETCWLGVCIDWTCPSFRLWRQGIGDNTCKRKDTQAETLMRLKRKLLKDLNSDHNSQDYSKGFVHFNIFFCILESWLKIFVLLRAQSYPVIHQCSGYKMGLLHPIGGGGVTASFSLPSLAYPEKASTVQRGLLEPMTAILQSRKNSISQVKVIGWISS